MRNVAEIGTLKELAAAVCYVLCAYAISIRVADFARTSAQR